MTELLPRDIETITPAHRALIAADAHAAGRAMLALCLTFRPTGDLPAPEAAIALVERETAALRAAGRGGMLAPMVIRFDEPGANDESDPGRGIVHVRVTFDTDDIDRDAAAVSGALRAALGPNDDVSFEILEAVPMSFALDHGEIMVALNEAGKTSTRSDYPAFVPEPDADWLTASLCWKQEGIFFWSGPLEERFASPELFEGENLDDYGRIAAGRDPRWIYALRPSAPVPVPAPVEACAG